MPSKNAIEAGRAAHLAGLGRVLERGAQRIRSADRIFTETKERVRTWQKINFFIDSDITD